MSRLTIRNCIDKDCEYVYILANDRVYRKNSFNSDFIKYDEHLEWFKNSMKNSNRYIFIVEFDDIDVGQIRIDIIKDNNAEISYVIEEKYRNRGIGTEILTLIKEYINENFINIKKIIGKVKKENIPSRKAFINNGYLEKELDYYYEYSLILKE